MSRRHHGRSHQGGRYRHEPARPAPGVGPGTMPASVDASSAQSSAIPDIEPRVASTGPETSAVPEAAVPAPDVTLAGEPQPAPLDQRPRPPEPARTNGHTNGSQAAHTNGHANGQDRGTGCTAPQLRRFIKSRPYVPMHELRRRFAIDGGDDEVTQVSIGQGHLYVGLPTREGLLLGELLRGGEIGYELSLDPRSPVVVGLYPMRPVART